MKTQLDLSDAVIADLVVQAPPAGAALLDIVVQQEQRPALSFSQILRRPTGLRWSHPNPPRPARLSRAAPSPLPRLRQLLGPYTLQRHLVNDLPPQQVFRGVPVLPALAG